MVRSVGGPLGCEIMFSPFAMAGCCCYSARACENQILHETSVCLSVFVCLYVAWSCVRFADAWRVARLVVRKLTTMATRVHRAASTAGTQAARRLHSVRCLTPHRVCLLAIDNQRAALSLAKKVNLPGSLFPHRSLLRTRETGPPPCWRHLQRLEMTH